VQTRGVGQRFETVGGTLDVLNGIDLDIEPGEFRVIVGPSGCGKTTLLRILAGLDEPAAGSVEITTSAGMKARKAMVFQGRSVFPWLTVRDNVAYGLKLQGAGRRERRETADELLAIVGLSAFAGAYPHQVSEGMRQRVAIARALAIAPNVLLMDEPFGALDEQNRLLLQEELVRIWETTGKTVVFITHSLDEALVLGDRIAVMGANPGHVKALIEVPFSRPRSLTAIRADTRYGELFGYLWSLLRDEVSKTRVPPGVRPRL
jgi:NitT/TauT family transport system ATP-binding protein